MTTEEIDCDYTREVVCPYCGNEFSDSFELSDAQDTDKQIKCDECEKTFIYSTNYEVTYSSRQVPCLNGEPHDWYKPQGIIENTRYHTCKSCGKFELITNEEAR